MIVARPLSSERVEEQELTEYRRVIRVSQPVTNEITVPLEWTSQSRPNLLLSLKTDMKVYDFINLQFQDVYYAQYHLDICCLVYNRAKKFYVRDFSPVDVTSFKELIKKRIFLLPSPSLVFKHTMVIGYDPIIEEFFFVNADSVALGVFKIPSLILLDINYELFSFSKIPKLIALFKSLEARIYLTHVHSPFMIIDDWLKITENDKTLYIVTIWDEREENFYLLPSEKLTLYYTVALEQE
jgi:hypothetical protein